MRCSKCASPLLLPPAMPWCSPLSLPPCELLTSTDTWIWLCPAHRAPSSHLLPPQPSCAGCLTSLPNPARLLDLFEQEGHLEMIYYLEMSWHSLLDGAQALQYGTSDLPQPFTALPYLDHLQGKTSSKTRRARRLYGDKTDDLGKLGVSCFHGDTTFQRKGAGGYAESIAVSAIQSPPW